MLATNHGHSPSDDLMAAELCQVLKLEITQIIQDSLENIKIQLNQQYTALTTNTMMEMTTMMMMMLPPSVHLHGPHDPANCKIELKLAQDATTPPSLCKRH